MWIWIVIGIVVVAAGTWAFWPRRRGIADTDVLSSRRTTHGDNEGRHATNMNAWPPGG